MMSTILD
ncbi:hypothetical protein G4B88_005992 [Cannabis sativa]|nr:hypothetical protein G4B88_005992 [Cannabis sativa]